MSISYASYEFKLMSGLRDPNASMSPEAIGAAYRPLAFLVAITPRSIMRRIMGKIFSPRRAFRPGPGTTMREANAESQGLS